MENSEPSILNGNGRGNRGENCISDERSNRVRKLRGRAATACAKFRAAPQASGGAGGDAEGGSRLFVGGEQRDDLGNLAQRQSARDRALRAGDAEFSPVLPDLAAVHNDHAEAG